MRYLSMLWRFIPKRSALYILRIPTLSCRHIKTSASSLAATEYVPFGDRGIYDAGQIAMTKQWKLTKAKGGQKRQKLDPEKEKWPDGNHDDVLRLEVQELLQRPKGSTDGVPKDESTHTPADSEEGDFHETELQIEELSSVGEGLARSRGQDHVFVIPFTLPGEKVLARVRRNPGWASWSEGDLVKVLEPSTKREGVTPQCKYFGTCSGCQFQMLPYGHQLAHKKTVVEKAYHNFSGLKHDQLPEIARTGASPLQYGYRTKLTPHFDGPGRKEKRYTSVPPIGFTLKGRKKVMDIESCPIGTEIVQEGLKRERALIAANISSFKNGATILLRETTERVFNEPASIPHASSLDPLPPASSKSLTTTSDSKPQLTLTYPSLPFTDIETYVRDEKGFSTEYIGSYKFTTRAGAFFQNNNSILPSFLTYIRSNALPPPSSKPDVKYLLDAYSGAGLFALTLSPLFQSVLGIEIDSSSVAHARTNAVENDVTNCGFIEADASDLFADVPYPPEQTVVVIDPPRKGCSKDFLRQLLGFGPRRVIYVSCNVNSQARDVGVMMRGGIDGEETKGGWRYEIESLKGWDFFPQTGHVEGVCVLNRVEKEETGQKTEAYDGEQKAWSAFA